MTHHDALDSLADHPHAWRFRQLTAEDNPDVAQREAYRALVIRLARGDPPDSPQTIPVDYGEPSPGPCGGCPGG